MEKNPRNEQALSSKLPVRLLFLKFVKLAHYKLQFSFNPILDPSGSKTHPISERLTSKANVFQLRIG
ncbi:hypothetical protein C1H46_045797 [Malus baccata]|uniref:Uncharacterized protein n=1 Tax=Malus baccata TaxID=106549 RepID=A0A540K344_MALBA|nr:hypothetical protein C1H46_045797 [Malus baccata]